MNTKTTQAPVVRKGTPVMKKFWDKIKKYFFTPGHKKEEMTYEEFVRLECKKYPTSHNKERYREMCMHRLGL